MGGFDCVCICEVSDACANMPPVLITAGLRTCPALPVLAIDDGIIVWLGMDWGKDIVAAVCACILAIDAHPPPHAGMLGATSCTTGAAGLDGTPSAR